MKKDTLTISERRIAKAWRAAGLHCLCKPDVLRRHIKTTAFHEAAHVAAQMFTGLESGHIVHVSIIPDDHNYGHVRIERSCTESIFMSYPPPVMQYTGRMLLLNLMAGRGAEARIDESVLPEYRENILDDWELEWEAENEGSDLFRAQRIADIMSRPGMPARRILALAAKWTEEMLALPEVWRAVETLGAMLIRDGIIEDREKIMTACDGIYMGFVKIPAWKRRFMLPKAIL